MLMMRLKELDGHRSLTTDIIMLQGKGAPLGYRKLSAFGVEKGATKLDSDDLIGKRVWCQIVHEDYRGEPQCKVDINAKDSHAGYWTEDPRGGGTPDVKEDVPF